MSSPCGFSPALLREVLPAIDREAAATDQDGAYPAAGVAALHRIGLLAAPLHGLGTAPEGADGLALALRLIGRASLPLGRLYEGHVNALRLILRHGTRDQIALGAADARDGHLFAIWNTDDARAPVRLDGEVLSGRKVLCSGAGFVRRALITAEEERGAGPVLLLLPLRPGEGADLSGWQPLGMRASASGAVDFTGMPAPPQRRIGAPGAYARQPDFTAGGWRFAAVQCGGIEAVLEALRSHHRRTGRGSNPHQAARLGQAAIAAEGARLWVQAAARRAESGAPDAVAYTNLARTAVERAALDVLELAQRSIGLAGFMRGHPLERIARDLSTYLRQPAPDAALTEAGSHVLDTAAEAGDLWA
ncbi:acyl-CoA dehydrogenase [Roseomonas hellenica]|uniref:Acyl-CoA dehydrogenase n=1 Tax=Plastoroseomonas hellenica TaxID=2687306 RepID=A0ABS5EYT8_9PROT|nr:acyl-CoA dehydrogenase family protein [Plastoroseomonas hellenica]MBR0665457.1 acyl-CoA dehydrogenase [Plastoroseomonas hellenica]